MRIRNFVKGFSLFKIFRLNFVKILSLVILVTSSNYALSQNLAEKPTNTQPSPTIQITQNQQGLFTGTLKNAPLREVFKKLAQYTKLKFFVYPKVDKTYNLKFANYTEKKLIDTLSKGLNSYRILAKNDKGINYTKAITLLAQGNTNTITIIPEQITKYSPKSPTNKIKSKKTNTKHNVVGSIYKPRPQNEAKPIIEEIYNGIKVAYVADELLIRINPSKNISEQIRRLDREVKKYGGVLAERMHRLKYFVARFELGIDIKLVRDKLIKKDYITAIEPNYFAKLTSTATNTTNTNKWHLNTLNIPVITDITSNIFIPKIAIIDTGVDANTTQLIGKVRPIANTINNTTNSHDDNGHGTTMALLVLQTAPNAIIHAVKVMDKDGIGTYADIAEGIFYALDRKIQVINISLGGYKPSQILQDAITYAKYKGVTVVAAVGNDGL